MCLREIAEAARFPDFCFAERRSQPMEHFDCAAEGSAWLSSDRRTIRPVPDEMDSYDEADLRERYGSKRITITRKDA